jgi:hypothetical protein
VNWFEGADKVRREYLTTAFGYRMIEGDGTAEKSLSREVGTP